MEQRERERGERDPQLKKARANLYGTLIIFEPRSTSKSDGL